MKKALVLSLMLLVFGAIAFAGPSLNPWFEVNVPDARVAIPTLEAGAIVEGMLSPAWFIDLGVTYEDPNLLATGSDVVLGFEANVGFDQRVTVDVTGSLVYGCLLSMFLETTLRDIGGNFPTQLELQAREPGFLVEGYVGPLTVWGGVAFPWVLGGGQPDFKPSFGISVDFIIDL